jgi:hypothetical protein
MQGKTKKTIILIDTCQAGEAGDGESDPRGDAQRFLN